MRLILALVGWLVFVTAVVFAVQPRAIKPGDWFNLTSDPDIIMEVERVDGNEITPAGGLAIVYRSEVREVRSRR